MILKTHAAHNQANTRVLQIARVDQEELQKANIAELSSLKMSQRPQSGVEKAINPRRTNPPRHPRTKKNRPSYVASAVT